MTPSPAETTGTTDSSIRAEGLLRLGMTMADRRRRGWGDEDDEEGYGEGAVGGGGAVGSTAALSLRDDVDYSRPVAAVSVVFPFL